MDTGYSRCIYVCSCNSGDGSYTKKFSSAEFSHRALWVSLLVLHSTQGRMFSPCNSESASLSPTPPPPVPHAPPACHCISTHQPIHFPFHYLACFSYVFFSQWNHGEIKSRLFKEGRSFSNSLITWHSVLASWHCSYSHLGSLHGVICVHSLWEIYIMSELHAASVLLAKDA